MPLSKLLERLVARQLMRYLSFFDLLLSLQSGCRPGHSTETAVLWVLSDILLAADRGDVSALVLLDMTAAFDTVIIRSCCSGRSHATFSMCDAAHRWFQSYLSGRKQHVRCGSARSSTTYLVCLSSTL